MAGRRSPAAWTCVGTSSPRKSGTASVSAPCDSLTTVLAYHERTKHFPGRYARALGYLDWATQPNPFRRFQGAPLLPLELVPVGEEPRYERAFVLGSVPPAPLDRRLVSQLLHDSLALS